MGQHNYLNYTYALLVSKVIFIYLAQLGYFIYLMHVLTPYPNKQTNTNARFGILQGMQKTNLIN